MCSIKKFVACIVSLAIVFSLCSVGSISAFAKENTNSSAEDFLKIGYINFDSTGWENVNAVYAQVWINNGKSFFKKEYNKNTSCEKESDNIWKYNLAKLYNSTTVKSGFEKGIDYCVVFYTDTNIQTCEMTLGLPCLNDTAKLTGKKYENPTDSSKTDDEAIWTNNRKLYGPHRKITATGKYIGSKLCPNEETIRVIGDWLVKYSDNSKDPTKVVYQALKEFKIKDIDAVYAYVMSKKADKTFLKKVKGYLEEAYKKQYKDPLLVDSDKAKDLSKEFASTGKISKTTNISINLKNKDIRKGIMFQINGVPDKGTKWTTSNKNIVSVTQKGLIKGKNAGKAVITCKYGKKVKKITIYVTNLGHKEYGKGKKVTLTSLFKYVSGYKKGKWSSSNSKKISVKNGKITCKSHGSATITLKVSGKNYKVVVYNYDKTKLKNATLDRIKERVYYPKTYKATKVTYLSCKKVKIEGYGLNRDKRKHYYSVYGCYSQGYFDAVGV